MPVRRKENSSNDSDSSNCSDSSDGSNSSDYTDCEVIFDHDDFVITDMSNFWIYILTSDQWDIIKTNIDNKKFYISAFLKSNIKDGDIILFYKKVNNTSNSGGYVAVAETAMDMLKNDGTLDTNNKKNSSGKIKVYKDTNMNRFVTKIWTAIIFDTSMGNDVFTGMINNKNSRFKNVQQFIFKTIKGECNFTPIESKELGLNLVKKMIEESENDHDLNSEINSNYDSDADNESENKIEKIHSIFTTSESSETFDNSDKSSILDSDTSNNSEISIDILTSEDNGRPTHYETKSNIPILLVPCSDLPKDINKLSRDKNIVQMIYHHYIHCDKCDITNNGNKELSDSIRGVKITNVKYVLDNHVDILMSYLTDELYPKVESIEEIEKKKIKLDHHVTFHHIKNDPIYSECILIDFTSRVKNLISVNSAILKAKNVKKARTKVKTKVRVKNKKIKK